MPRYFFDVHDGMDLIDKDGTVLPDVEGAKEEAAVHAAGLLRHGSARFWDGDEWTLRVRDEHGLILFELVVFANLAPVLFDRSKRKRSSEDDRQKGSGRSVGS